MNILIDIGHPGHVHFFRPLVERLRTRDHGVTVVSRDLATARHLLDSYGFRHAVVPRKRSKIRWRKLNMIAELIHHNVAVAKLIRQQQIDVCTSIGGTYMVYAARFYRCRSVVFTDTETARTANRITFPFADRIVTPTAFKGPCPPAKHHTYEGSHELVYMHPDTFHPDPACLELYDLKVERYVVFRLSSWGAAHDIGQEGVSEDTLLTLAGTIEDSGLQVVIVPEGNVPACLRSWVLPIDPAHFHQVLAFAGTCITEGATTAAEACLLGTRTVYVNPVQPACTKSLAVYPCFRLVHPRDSLDLPTVYGALLKEQDLRQASLQHTREHYDHAALLDELLQHIEAR